MLKINVRSLKDKYKIHKAARGGKKTNYIQSNKDKNNSRN